MLINILSGIILSLIALVLWMLLIHENQYDYEYMEDQIRKRKEERHDC